MIFADFINDNPDIELRLNGNSPNDQLERLHMQMIDAIFIADKSLKKFKRVVMKHMISNAE